MRQEACKGLYRLCLGQPDSPPSASQPSSETRQQYMTTMLTSLIQLLPIAVAMQPLMNEVHDSPDSRKCTVGASCQDYLWLTSQLLEGLENPSIPQVIYHKIMTTPHPPPLMAC